MKKGKVGGQNGIGGRESWRLYQNIPKGFSGCHLSTQMKNLPKQGKSIQVSADSLHSTHQSTPLLNIIYGINPSTKLPCEGKDFNPI